jgi:hypothetical protein
MAAGRWDTKALIHIIAMARSINSSGGGYSVGVGIVDFAAAAFVVGGLCFRLQALTAQADADAVVGSLWYSVGGGRKREREGGGVVRSLWRERGG